jgi:ubiquinone/menaquinone biosynthesis C-methylase UbiE
MNEKWKVWENEKNYGDTFYKRSVGDLPEMESSKSLARKIKPLISENDHILDVGCGGGHYLVSLDKILDKKFIYTGIDATGYYIEKANEAFIKNRKLDNPLRTYTKFIHGDIYDLPFSNNYGDIVICANVLLHLPSLEKPLNELARVASKYVVVRTLVGDSAFRIKHIREPEEYDKQGDPVNYYYFNIYSENYIRKIAQSLPGIKDISFGYDKDFIPENIGAKEYIAADVEVPSNVTKILNGMQVNHYILQPWQYIILSKV